MESIRAVWNSPQYAKLKKLRQGSGEPNVWAVLGM
jgi:uncharacterized protein (DUF1330 family)